MRGLDVMTEAVGVRDAVDAADAVGVREAVVNAGDEETTLAGTRAWG